MAQSSVDNLVVLLEPSVLEVDVAVETDGTVDGKGSMALTVRPVARWVDGSESSLSERWAGTRGRV
jgi:hypothetical protein